MKKQTLFTAILFCIVILNITCKKNEAINQYTGKVLDIIPECNSSAGSPILIEIQGIKLDTICTVTLETTYKVEGKIIKFKMRDLIQNDVYIVCNTNIVAPKQMVVYDVSNQ